MRLASLKTNIDSLYNTGRPIRLGQRHRGLILTEGTETGQFGVNRDRSYWWTDNTPLIP